MLVDYIYYLCIGHEKLEKLQNDCGDNFFLYKLQHSILFSNAIPFAMLYVYCTTVRYTYFQPSKLNATSSNMKKKTKNKINEKWNKTVKTVCDLSLAFPFI